MFIFCRSDWFRKDRPEKKVPKLTDHIIKQLIEEALITSHDLFQLRGYTQATLDHVSVLSPKSWVFRAEVEELKVALLKPSSPESSYIMVVGEKGIGKTRLVKQVLDTLHPATYLFLSATDLLINAELREKLLKVIKKIKEIQVIIDGAEILISGSSIIAKELLHALKMLKKPPVLTLTSEAEKVYFSQEPGLRICLKPLILENILLAFPHLQHYGKVQNLMKLAQIPFYLSLIIKLMVETQPFKLINIGQAGSSEGEGKLINLAICGKEADKVKARLLAWQKLAMRIFLKSNKFKKSSVLEALSIGHHLLLEENIILKAEENRYYFEHDLFLEYGLMEFWLQKWEVAFIESETPAFWQSLSVFLPNYEVQVIFEKWFSRHRKTLVEDVTVCMSIISSMPYFNTMIGIAIVTQDHALLEACLSANNTLVNQSLDKVVGYSDITYVTLAILSHNAVALKMLFDFGAVLERPDMTKVREESVVSSNTTMTQSTDTETEASEEEEGYDYYSHTSEDLSETPDDHSVSDHATNPVFELIDSFSRDPNKYWQAGFKEEQGEFDEEGEWVANLSYQAPPRYDTAYIHEAILHKSEACLQGLLAVYTMHSKPHLLQEGNNFGETPLHVAVLNDQRSIVALLLQQEGIVIDVLDEWGESCLHNAVYKNDIACAKLLLKAGANPNILNNIGLSPVHIAVTHLNLAMVQLLMAYGGDLSQQTFNLEGMIIPDLLEAVAECNEEKKEAVEEFVLELIGECLNFGWADHFEWGAHCPPNPQLKAAQLEQVEELMTLVEHRAQLSEDFPGFDYTDEDTGLDFAIERGDLERIQNLKAFILTDEAYIEAVLEAESFLDYKDIILEDWFSEPTEEEYNTLKEYAKDNQDDEELLKHIDMAELVSSSEDEESKSSCTESEAESMSSTGSDESKNTDHTAPLPSDVETAPGAPLLHLKAARLQKAKTKKPIDENFNGLFDKKISLS